VTTDPAGDDPIPARDLYELAGLATPMAVRVAATLHVADHITSGHRTAAAIAEVAGADPRALDSVLRHLVAIGLLEHDPSRGYSLTDRGDVLRDDHPAGLRVHLDADRPLGRAELSFVQLVHSVRTGDAAFPVQFGHGFWDDLGTHAERGAAFDAAMGADVAAWAPAIAGAYDWNAVGHVVDVGGGDGTLAVELLRRFPDLRATVFDQPETAARATTTIASTGFGDRAVVVGGSFFDPLPAGADAYVLTAIVHDWDDAAAREILRRCAQAAGRAGRILVIEKIGTDGESPSSEMDLRMLVYFGGRERRPDELVALAESAGCRVVARHAAGAICILELSANPESVER
jgi:hypothetical protein